MSVVKYITFSSILLLTACHKQTETSDKTISDKSVASHTAPISEVPTASTTGTTVVVADTPATLPPPPVEFQQLDVPIFIKGTPALLHPLVTVIKDSKVSAIKDFSSKSSDKDSTDNNYRTIQTDYFNQVGLFDYQTNIDNLVFEDINQESSQRLFNQNNFKIRRVFFPYIDESNRFYSDNKTYIPKNIQPKTANSTPKTASTTQSTNSPVNQKFTVNSIEVDGVKYKALPRVLFEVNEAGKNGSSEKMALYMSDNFGHGITRLHPANQFLVSSEWVEALQRFYFITQVDSDNNGVMNDKDQTFHYYVDFTTSMPTINAYRY